MSWFSICLSYLGIHIIDMKESITTIGLLYFYFSMQMSWILYSWMCTDDLPSPHFGPGTVNLFVHKDRMQWTFKYDLNIIWSCGHFIKWMIGSNLFNAFWLNKCNPTEPPNFHTRLVHNNSLLCLTPCAITNLPIYIYITLFHSNMQFKATKIS